MNEENEISRIILDCAYKVHTKLGSGLLIEGASTQTFKCRIGTDELNKFRRALNTIKKGWL